MPQEPPKSAIQKQHKPNPGLSGATYLPPVLCRRLQVELFHPQETLITLQQPREISPSRPPKKHSITYCILRQLFHTFRSSWAGKKNYTRLHTKMTDAFEQASGNLSDLSDFAFSPPFVIFCFRRRRTHLLVGDFAFRRRLCSDHTHCFSAFYFCFGGFVSITSFSAFGFCFRF